MVRRLIIEGVPVTWAFGAVFAGLLLGMSSKAGDTLVLLASHDRGAGALSERHTSG